MPKTDLEAPLTEIMKETKEKNMEEINRRFCELRGELIELLECSEALFDMKDEVFRRNNKAMIQE